MKIELDVKVTVEDPAELMAEAKGFRAPAETVEQALGFFFQSPVSKPSTVGYEVDSLEVLVLDQERPRDYTLRMNATITNGDLLIEEAKELLAQWGDKGDDLDLHAALYEVQFASNASPSPSDLGIVIQGYGPWTPVKSAKSALENDGPGL